MDIQEEAIQLLTERYGWSKEEIIHAEDFRVLGLDSLTIYSLVTECEEKFGIILDIDDITEISSPVKFINYIEERVCDEKEKNGK